MSLPLPIALLRRRARNAKSPKERHDTAYFAWEASLRLAAAKHPLPEDLDVSAPSAGQFARWLGTRDDDPTLDDDATLACFALLTEIGAERKSAPRAVSAKKLIDALPAYRNRVLGHGSTRANDFYQSSADTLLACLDSAWTAGAFLSPVDELVFVESVELASSGARKARALSLMGMASEAEEVDAPPEDVRPSRVYLRCKDRWTSLHPWVLFEGGELRERVLFFNGRTKGARFLDYVSGEELKGKALVDAFPDVDDALAATIRSKPKAGPPSQAEPSDPNAFGDYRILGKLGEGGMGVVYLAEQKGLGRVVALKMLPAAAADDAVAVGRFKREIAALSKCDHPNVAKILASGVEKGTHYYAMEFIDGVDLSQVSPKLVEGSDFDDAVSTAAERLRESKKELFESVPSLAHPRIIAREPIQTTRALVALFRDAAFALQHLHEAGIVHRDVKPANLMVTSTDHRLVLMDLGLAAVGNASKTLTRDASSILGTLRYMPPEQLQRNLLDVDHRADIYSLGVSFYELLTSHPFFDGDTEARLIEQILRQEPLPPRKAKPSLPRDLCVVLEKATRKDSKERYATAGALAADLDAFLEGRPIAARPATLGYLFMLSVRRHKAIAAMIALGIVGTITGVSAYLSHERALRQEAETARTLAEQLRNAADVTAIDLLSEQGRLEIEAGHDEQALVLLDEAYRRGGRDVVLREYLARQLARVGSREAGGRVAKPLGAVSSPGGARVASGGDDGVVTIADSSTGEKLRALDARAGAVTHIQFSHDGTRLMSTHGDGGVRTWDSVSGGLLATMKPEGGALAADLRADGNAVVTASPTGATLWDARTGARITELGGTGSVAARFEVGGTRVVIGGNDASASVWSMSGKLLATMHASARVADVHFVDENVVATACDDGAVSLWDVAKEKVIASVRVPRPVQSITIGLVLHKEEQKQLQEVSLLVLRSDGVVQSWDVAFHDNGEASPKLSPPDDPGALSTSLDHGISWGTRNGATDLQLDRRTYQPFAFPPDSSMLVWGTDIVDLVGGAVLPSPGSSQPTNDLRLSRTVPCPRPVFAASKVATADEVLRITDARTAQVVVEIPAAQTSTGDPPDSIALSPDAGLVACAYDSERPRVFKLPGGEKAFDIDEPSSAYAPNSQVLFGEPNMLITCRAAHCTVWDAATGAKQRELRGHSEAILDASASPDGTRLVTASSDGTARVWNLASGNSFAILRGHGGQVLRALFSTDGSYITTASADGTVKTWDALTGAFRRTIVVYGGPIYSLAVAPDGVRIATGDSTGNAIVWDVRTGRAIDRLRIGDSDSKWIFSVEFSPEGAHLGAELPNGKLAVKDVHLESRSAEEVHRLVEALALPWKLVNGQLVGRESLP